MLLEVNDLKKYYPIQNTILERLFARKIDYVKAVDGISFNIQKGEVFTLVGETGCGKTTTGRVILHLEQPTDGTITFNGTPLHTVKKWKPLRRQMQILFQDPFSSFSPKMKIGKAIGDPLKIHGIVGNDEEERREVETWLDRVGLTPVSDYYNKYPQGLSGGEIQRAALARAMILNPKLIVADEPTSNLDVSLQARVLDLLNNFKTSFNTTFLYITHNLAVAKYISDRIGVMYLGKLMELGSRKDIFLEPAHPYTKALLSTIPVPNPNVERRGTRLKQEPPDPINIPPGCRFHPRCPQAMEKCKKKMLERKEISDDHYVWCHRQ